MRILGIADDLTGALEAGAKFAQAGLPAVVYSGRRLPVEDTRTAVIDTGTRHLEPSLAGRIVAACAMQPVDLIYKKTDSTLRGNIGAELLALSRLFPESRIAYAPAYPALGRTVRNGVLYVDARPVNETEFALDALNPVRSARVDSLLPIDLPCDIFDGKTDDDIARVARRIVEGREYRIAAGPGALAAALAQQLGGGAAAPQWPVVRSCLVVNGSRHPASLRQMEESAARGGGWRLMTADVEAGTTEQECARHTGCRVRRELESAAPDALVIFGGDTAAGILAALENPLLLPVGEILPGVPVSQIEGRRTILITKAGGFGHPRILESLERELNG